MLFRVLPYPIHKEALAVYKRKINGVRVGIALICLVILLVCIAAAYLGVLTQVRSEQQLLRASNTASEDRRQFDDVNKTTTSLVQALSGVKQPISVVATLGKTIAAIPPGIIVTGFSFDETQKEKGTIRLAVRGIALTRTDLQTLERQLRAEPTFKQVDVPIDQLAKREDINFSITIIMSI